MQEPLSLTESPTPISTMLERTTLEVAGELLRQGANVAGRIYNTVRGLNQPLDAKEWAQFTMQETLVLQPLLEQTHELDPDRAHKMFVIGHWWDDIADAALCGKEQGVVGTREKITSILQTWQRAEHNEQALNDCYTAIRQAVSSSQPGNEAPAHLMPIEMCRELDAIDSEMDNFAESDPLRKKIHQLSMVRLMASGLAQTEWGRGHVLDPDKGSPQYEQLSGIVSDLSLEMTENEAVKSLINKLKPEMLIGPLVSGSQELFSVIHPEIKITAEYVDAMTLFNILLGAPIYYDTSVADRKSLDQIEIPEQDRVSLQEFQENLNEVCGLIQTEFKDEPRVTGMLGQIRTLHRTLSFGLVPHSFAKVDAARPGFGTAIKQAYKHLLNRAN